MPSRVSQLVLFGVGVLVFATANANAQTPACKPGTQISGTTTIQKLDSVKGGVGMTVSSFTDCKLTFVVIPLKAIMESPKDGAANCRGAVRSRSPASSAAAAGVPAWKQAASAARSCDASRGPVAAR
jgi:hypothetical protein